MFGDGKIIHDPAFVGRACVGGLDAGRQVRAEFVTMGHADHYEACLLYTSEAGHRAADGHITIGAPDKVLRLLPEPALLGPAVALVPDSSSPPDPPRPLEGVAGGGELAPRFRNRHSGIPLLVYFPSPLFTS